jgi:predicted DNA-binding transcriptional regulator AlpA
MLTADSALSAAERSAIKRLINGNLEKASSKEPQPDRLLVTQKSVAALLSVSRVTVWRMTKNGILHPVEILSGTWRYSYAEIAELAAPETRPFER